jgi:hypothetical protein
MQDVPALDVRLMAGHHDPVVAAISRGVGSRMRDLPITEEKVKKAVKS